MLTQVESMNYQPLIRPNHLHGRWAGRGAPPTSLPNPRWGERVDAAEGVGRKRLDLIQVTVSVSFVARLVGT